MKKAIAVLLFVTVASLTAASQTPKYGVTVTPEKNVDYASFRTYTWKPAIPSPVKEIDAQIVAAIDRELGSLGMTKADAGASDVLVSYSSLTRTDVNTKGKTDSKGLLPQYTVGTLVVVLVKPDDNKRLLRMRADIPVDTARDKLEGEINRVVGLMFAEYPTRTKNKKG